MTGQDFLTCRNIASSVALQIENEARHLQYLIQSRSGGSQNPFDVPIGVNRLRLYVTAEHLPLRVKRRDARQIKNVPEAHAIGETELLVRQHIRRLNDVFHGDASQQ